MRHVGMQKCWKKAYMLGTLGMPLLPLDCYSSRGQKKGYNDWTRVHVPRLLLTQLYTIYHDPSSQDRTDDTEVRSVTSYDAFRVQEISSYFWTLERCPQGFPNMNSLVLCPLFLKPIVQNAWDVVHASRPRESFRHESKNMLGNIACVSWNLLSRKITPRPEVSCCKLNGPQPRKGKELHMLSSEKITYIVYATFKNTETSAWISDAIRLCLTISFEDPETSHVAGSWPSLPKLLV